MHNSDGERQLPVAKAISATRVRDMAQPKSIRAKFGTPEYSAATGVTPIKKKGFGSSAMRGTAQVKPPPPPPSEDDGAGKVWGNSTATPKPRSLSPKRYAAVQSRYSQMFLLKQPATPPKVPAPEKRQMPSGKNERSTPYGRPSQSAGKQSSPRQTRPMQGMRWDCACARVGQSST